LRLKILEKLRTTRLNSEFTGSYKKVYLEKSSYKKGIKLVNWMMDVSIGDGGHRLVQERTTNTKFDFEVTAKYC